MFNHRILKGIATLALWLGLSQAVRAAAFTEGSDMAYAATNWLNALTPAQRTNAVYAFDDQERFDWHFIPKSRKGLPFKEMTAAQQKLAQGLLSSGLSQRGYVEATTIMSLEEVLAAIEQGKGPVRDADRYFFTIFGEPGGVKVWGWRVEGHHLSLNFVVQGNQVLAASPTFFGSNPGVVVSGQRKGLSILALEDRAGREFVSSLTPELQTAAIFTNHAPNEIITGNLRKAMLLAPAGVSVAQLPPAQRTALWNLIQHYATRHRPEVAKADLDKIEAAGFEKVTFAWAGSLKPGEGHYYRIEGPTFLMEFDDTQNNANHIHTVWRDLTNDFGDDVLKAHYEETPHHH